MHFCNLFNYVKYEYSYRKNYFSTAGYLNVCVLFEFALYSLNYLNDVVSIEKKTFTFNYISLNDKIKLYL